LGDLKVDVVEHAGNKVHWAMESTLISRWKEYNDVLLREQRQSEHLIQQLIALKDGEKRTRRAHYRGEHLTRTNSPL